jgi:hypothetical protein
VALLLGLLKNLNVGCIAAFCTGVISGVKNGKFYLFSTTSESLFSASACLSISR